jgi:ribonuclease HII
MPDKNFLKEINDSKKIPEKKREKLYKKLIEMSL